MLQIRSSFFETNSSSCHALIINMNASGKLPSKLFLDEDSDEGNYIRKFIRELNKRDTKKLANWLYMHGVESIVYHGNNIWLNQYMDDYKDSYSDLGLPKGEDWTDGAIINLFLQDFVDYAGYEDVEHDDDEMVWILDFCD